MATVDKSTAHTNVSVQAIKTIQLAHILRQNYRDNHRVGTMPKQASGNTVHGYSNKLVDSVKCSNILQYKISDLNSTVNMHKLCG